MMRATTAIRKSALGDRAAVATITLDREGRYRRRIAMSTDQGQPFLLDLPEATYLADGDALALDDGTLVRVVAKAETLIEIRAATVAALSRLAWHIGNRHTPAEIGADALYIQPDHVLEAMIEGLGGQIRRVSRPFEPEGGAYGGKGPLQSGHHHGHHHDGHHHHHGHDHNHEHGHPHSHAQTTAVGDEVRPLATGRVWRPK